MWVCRAQQHMEQTLDGMCVRVAHNHTFDGLWLRMANDFKARLGRPAVRVGAPYSPPPPPPPISLYPLQSAMLCCTVLCCAELC